LSAVALMYAERLAATQRQRSGALRPDLYEGARNGHLQSDSVRRPEY
jgi:hypothetical protein